MSIEDALPLADAILYEGYALYPYRPSALKNRFRWQFGVVTPRVWAREASEHCVLSTMFLIASEPAQAIDVALRFLQIAPRASGWDEAEERRVDVRFDLRNGRSTTAVPFHDGRDEAALTLVAEPAGDDLTRLEARIENHSPYEEIASREAVLRHSLVGTHLLFEGTGFLSVQDPPPWARAAADGCRQGGLWPVLVGTDTVLAAPLILSDYPRIAPESRTQMFDATEIDELLALRTQTLLEDERAEARAWDPRVASLLDHVETMATTQGLTLHGTRRDEIVIVRGVPIGPGSTVVLQPGARRTDAQDIFLRDHAATVEKVVHDVDGRTYLAVILDVPGADILRQQGRYLYFDPDEVAPIAQDR